MAQIRRVAWFRRLLHLRWGRDHSHCGCNGNCDGTNFAGCDQLSNDDVHDRRINAALAGHRGQASLARRLLSDPDATTRSIALGALGRLNRLTATELETALNDSNVSVRRRALELATKWPDVKIEFCLGDLDSSVADAAAFSLGEREEIGAVNGLARMAATHEDQLCRETAVAALGALATIEGSDRPAILVCLLGAMKDRAEIRRRAILGLFQFEEAEARRAVEGALRDKDRQVRAVASELLGVVSD